MARKYVDCRDYPSSDPKCTVAISADSEDELVSAAMQHMVSVHHAKDTPELRKQVRQSLKTGNMPA